MSETPGPDLTDPSVYAEWTGVTVRYRDLDPNNHVNNGSINGFFEDGRVAFRDARMGDLPGGILTGFAVVSFAATYRAAVHYPGTVEVGTVVTRIGSSSYGLGQGLFQGGRCCATAEVVTVHLDPVTGRASPLPDAVRAVLEGALAQAG